MKHKEGPLGLEVAIIKITGHIGQFVGGERLADYRLLNQHLKEIQDLIKPFVWIEVHSTNNIDYRKYVPTMADMIEWINKFKIESILHHWHYQENNDDRKLDELIELTEDFLFFIKKELD